jgi:cobalamin synthase
VGAVPLVAAAFIWSAWTPALVALGWGAAFGVWMNRRLGGLTGDVYGASVETAEVLWFGALSAAVNA